MKVLACPLCGVKSPEGSFHTSAHLEGLTLREAADYLDGNPDVLRRQIHRGKLAARKVGRDWTVRLEEVQRYSRENRRRA